MYKIINSEIVLNLTSNEFISVDEDNQQFKDYLEWVSLGNVAEAADPEPKIVLTCTRRQGRLALLSTGYLVLVEDHLNSITDPHEAITARIEYEADTWESTNTFVMQMWDLLGGDAESLDALFQLAITL